MDPIQHKHTSNQSHLRNCNIRQTHRHMYGFMVLFTPFFFSQFFFFRVFFQYKKNYKQQYIKKFCAVDSFLQKKVSFGQKLSYSFIRLLPWSCAWIALMGRSVFFGGTAKRYMQGGGWIRVKVGRRWGRGV